ncbi:MAG: hypothetical protein ABIA66_02470, partial [Candidatus Omnitrophota bacterium]
MSCVTTRGRFILTWNKAAFMKANILFIIFLVLPSIVYAQSYPIVRAEMVEQALANLEAQVQNHSFESPSMILQEEGRYIGQETLINPDTRAISRKEDVFPEERDSAIEKAFHDITIELALEYMVGAHGDQIFELIDSQGGLASRLTYPNKGQILFLKAEAGFKDRVFFGGRYGSSQFLKKTCSDEDWNIFDPSWAYGTDEYVDYQITKQISRPKVEIFDVNFYYRFLDLNRNKDKRGTLSPGKKAFFDNLMVDRLAFDIFIGYQQQKGRYGMVDPMLESLRFDEGDWYYLEGLPADIGLGSFYKIEYKGPRLGVRTEASRGKFTTKIRFAYAWLETKAHGWWNLRNLSYWQSGASGFGIDTGVEAVYAFLPSFSLGVGFNYFYCGQKKL